MAVSFVLGSNWTRKFGDAIGLEGIPIKSLVIRSEMDSILSAEVVMYIDQEGAGNLLEVAKTYLLTAVEVATKSAE